MNNRSITNRRHFLQASVLSSAVFGAENALNAQENRKAADHSGPARNVIFMVSDGMNLGALSLARQYRGLTE